MRFSNPSGSFHKYQQCSSFVTTWVSFTGFAEVVQLLWEGEDQQAAAGQTRDEHTQRHAGNSEPGECSLTV